MSLVGIKQFIFFNPTSLVKIVSKAAKFILVVGPSLGFTKIAKKVTEMTDPLNVTSRGMSIMFNYYFGKVGAVSI